MWGICHLLVASAPLFVPGSLFGVHLSRSRSRRACHRLRTHSKLPHRGPSGGSPADQSIPDGSAIVFCFAWRVNPGFRVLRYGPFALQVKSDGDFGGVAEWFLRVVYCVRLSAVA